MTPESNRHSSYDLQVERGRDDLRLDGERGVLTDLGEKQIIELLQRRDLEEQEEILKIANKLRDQGLKGNDQLFLMVALV
jgi:hypothetical protein